MLFSATPLRTAADNGHTEVVSALLKAGADLNAPLTLGLGMLSSLTPLSTVCVLMRLRLYEIRGLTLRV